MGGRINGGLGGCGLVFRWLGWCLGWPDQWWFGVWVAMGWCFGGQIGVWVSFFVVGGGGCWGACGGGVIFWVCDFWILILCF